MGANDCPVFTKSVEFEPFTFQNGCVISTRENLSEENASLEKCQGLDSFEAWSFQFLKLPSLYQSAIFQVTDYLKQRGRAELHSCSGPESWHFCTALSFIAPSPAMPRHLPPV